MIIKVQSQINPKVWPHITTSVHLLKIYQCNFTNIKLKEETFTVNSVSVQIFLKSSVLTYKHH